MTTFREQFGLRDVAPQNYAKTVPLQAACPTLIYGVELEIERIPALGDMSLTGFTATEDGSLRNNGKEFISKPMTFSNLMWCLNNFFTKNKFTEANYSERCSIHVHTNCLNLTLEQIQSLCMVYQVYEDLLFAWVSPERAENIFCVPWSQTTLSYKMFDKDPANWITKGKRWRKYTALNLLPLFTQGTVEFRHMPGTNDVKRIETWLQLIGCMFAYVQETPQTTIVEVFKSLNTTSAYTATTETIFKQWAGVLFGVPNFHQHLEEGVLLMKHSLMGSYNEPATKANAVFDDWRPLRAALEDAVDPRLDFNEVIRQRAIRAVLDVQALAVAQREPENRE